MAGSSRNRRHIKRDFFPSDGPVCEYKPFILAEAKKYSQLYYLRHDEVLVQAILLAHGAEEKFDAKRGTFGTLLRWELRRLHRWCQREYRIKYHGHPASKPKLEDWEIENERRKKKQERENRIRWRRRQRNPNMPEVTRNYARWKQRVDREQALTKLAKLRPHLENENTIAVADWMAGDIAGSEVRTMAQAAAAIGISKGYASKLVNQVARRLNFGNV